MSVATCRSKYLRRIDFFNLLLSTDRYFIKMVFPGIRPSVRAVKPKPRDRIGKNLVCRYLLYQRFRGYILTPIGQPLGELGQVKDHISVAMSLKFGIQAPCSLRKPLIYCNPYRRTHGELGEVKVHMLIGEAISFIQVPCT